MNLFRSGFTASFTQNLTKANEATDSPLESASSKVKGGESAGGSYEGISQLSPGGK